jgi:hypothetical protein
MAKSNGFMKGDGGLLLNSQLQPEKPEGEKKRPKSAPDQAAKIWNSTPNYRHEANTRQTAGTTKTPKSTLYRPSHPSFSPPSGSAAGIESEELSGGEEDSQSTVAKREKKEMRMSPCQGQVRVLLGLYYLDSSPCVDVTR